MILSIIIGSMLAIVFYFRTGAHATVNPVRSAMAMVALVAVVVSTIGVCIPHPYTHAVKTAAMGMASLCLAIDAGSLGDDTAQRRHGRFWYMVMAVLTGIYAVYG